MKTSLFVLSLGAALLSSTRVNAQNPKCCVCSDDCVSTITKPDAVVPLPSNPLLPVAEAKCEQIRNVAEDLKLIPEIYCLEFDVPEFRVACGCEVSAAKT